VQAQRRPPSKEPSKEKDDKDEDDERIESKEKDDALKITKNGKACYATDPDARWTVKGGKPF